jgi:hypothetical protein
MVQHPVLGEVVEATMPYPVKDPTDAACVNDARFTSDEHVDDPVKATALKVVCRGCPLEVGCREWGIAHETWGVFGGLDEAERRQWRRARRQIVVHPHAGVDDLIRRMEREALHATG